MALDVLATYTTGKIQDRFVALPMDPLDDQQFLAMQTLHNQM